MPTESNLHDACRRSWLGLRTAHVDGAHFKTPSNTVQVLAKTSLVDTMVQGLELLHEGKSVVEMRWVALLWAPAGTPAARPGRHRLSLSAGLALVEPNRNVRNSCKTTWSLDTELGLLWHVSFLSVLPVVCV